MILRNPRNSIGLLNLDQDLLQESRTRVVTCFANPKAFHEQKPSTARVSTVHVAVGHGESYQHCSHHTKSKFKNHIPLQK